MNSRLLQRAKTALLIIDMQEAFRNIIPDFVEISSRIVTLIRGCQILQIPIILTEQYPKGLGHTAKEIADSVDRACKIYEKTTFSCCGVDDFISELDEKSVEQILICGIEAHICVNQTAHDLLSRGFQVHLLVDCVSSRFKWNKEIGINKILQSGAIASSVEMALFEIMRESTHPCFKQIQALIK
jgi:nicotinamidase-related amidase